MHAAFRAAPAGSNIIIASSISPRHSVLDLRSHPRWSFSSSSSSSSSSCSSSLHSSGERHRSSRSSQATSSSSTRRCTARPAHATPAAAVSGPGAALHAAAASGKVGIVIVDHGSRKAASNLQLLEFARLFQELTGAPVVECAHMEIAEPSIEQAIGQCVAQGVDSVVVAPYFLSCGRHIQEDIPLLVKQAQAKYNGVHCVVADPIGVDALLAQLICNRVNAAVEAKVPA